MDVIVPLSVNNKVKFIFHISYFMLFIFIFLFFYFQKRSVRTLKHWFDDMLCY